MHQRLSRLIFTSSLQETHQQMLSIMEEIPLYMALWRFLPVLCASTECEVEDVLGNAEKLQDLYHNFKYGEDEEKEKGDASTFSLLYDHPHLDTHFKKLQPRAYSWVLCVWIRINVAHLLSHSSNAFYAQNVYTRDKLSRFCNAHLDAVRYLDLLEDPSNEHLDESHLCALYEGVGPSHYSEDLDMVRTHQERLQMLPTPLETLSAAYGSEWVAEKMDPERQDILDYMFVEYHYDPIRETVLSDALSSFSLYIGCVSVLETLHAKMQEEEEDADEGVMDALYFYYVAFMDVFAHALDAGGASYLTDGYLRERGCPGGRGSTVWQILNPFWSDTRAFHAGDLPDFFGTLTDIPLHGEQHKPSFMVAKVFQKCLPFCGQRRKLIEVVRSYNSESPAFWRLFSKVFWCLLAGMYPGDKQRLRMKELLRIRQLTDTGSARVLLGESLQEGEYEGSALVVFTAFRRYLTYMAQENEHYKRAADKCIDWSVFEQDTLKRAELIRGSNLFPKDVFGRARVLLTKMHKNNSKLEVYRYRKVSCVKMLANHCNNMLEKTVYQATRDWDDDKQLLQRIKQECATLEQARLMARNANSYVVEKTLQEGHNLREVCARLEQEIEWNLSQLQKPIDQTHKENLLNILLKVPIDKRLHPLSFSIMRLPQYGGVSMTTVEVMWMLVDIYYSKNAAPRKFQTQLRRLAVYDFKLVCCYFNMLLRLDKINFVVWDATTVRRIDIAMKHRRNILFPGQKLPPHAYNIIIKPCCQKIVTFMGRAFFGHKRVAYDINNRYLVCSKKRGKKESEKALAALEGEAEEGDQLTETVSILETLANGSDPKDIETVRKEIRRQRKDFLDIPCSGQPVLSINLRGVQLVWGNERDKKQRFAHCPECGALHEFKWQHYSGSVSGLYRCGECKGRQDLTSHSAYECCYCLARPTRPINSFQAGRTSLYVMDPMDADEPVRLLYFCKKHHKHARYKASQLVKEDLWIYIRERELRMRMRAAMGYFTK